METLTFTSEEIQHLHEQRFSYPDPKIRKHLEALFLKSQGFIHEEICALVRVSMSTLTRWVKIYREGGYKALVHTEYGKRRSELEPYR